jgi:hypothetical protein
MMESLDKFFSEPLKLRKSIDDVSPAEWDSVTKRTPPLTGHTGAVHTVEIPKTDRNFDEVKKPKHYNFGKY